MLFSIYMTMHLTMLSFIPFVQVPCTIDSLHEMAVVKMEYCLQLWEFWEAGDKILSEGFLWRIWTLWCMYVVLPRKVCTPHQVDISYFLVHTIQLFCLKWVLLLHENGNYCTQHTLHLHKLPNTNFPMISVVKWLWEMSGVKGSYFNLLLAAACP